MNYVKIAVRFSIAGLTLVMPLSSAAADDQQIKPVYVSVQETNRETETAVASVEGQNKKRKNTMGTVEAQVNTPAIASDTPVYNPPKRGAPGGRVGGGTRGPGSDWH